VIVQPSVHGRLLAATAFYEAIDELAEISGGPLLVDDGRIQPTVAILDIARIARHADGVRDYKAPSSLFAWALVDSVEITPDQVTVTLLAEPPFVLGSAVVELKPRVVTFSLPAAVPVAMAA
jgi:hypothetical protein